MMTGADTAGLLREHLESFFVGHRVLRREFDEGPIQTVAPGFHVISIAPGTKTNLWTHVSVGGCLVTKPDHPSIEFAVITEDDDDAYVERLAMTVHYHHTQTLGLGHTFPLGEPWVPGSSLDHALVSRPYPYGPEFERFSVGEGEHGHLFWILPITAAERHYKVRNGLEALEARFEEAGLEYWNVARRSVVR
jgi:hypothetical protein